MKPSILLLISVFLLPALLPAQDAQYWYSKGLIALDPVQKIEHFTQALELNPDFWEAYRHRGETYIELENFEEAIRDFDVLIRADGKNSSAYFQRGLAKYYGRQFEAASVDFQLAYKYRARDGSKLMLVPIDAFISISPMISGYNTLKTFAEILHLGLQKEALFYTWEQSPEKNFAFSPINALYFSGLANHRLENYSKAISDFSKALNLQRKNPVLYLKRGNVKLEMERYNAAIWDYDKAIKLHPKFHPAYIQRGKALQAKNEHWDAIFDFNQVIEFFPEDLRAHYYRALSFAKLGEHEKSLEDLQKLAQWDPNNSSLHLNIGILYLRLMQKDLAIKSYQRVLEIDPGNVEAKKRLADLK